MGQSTPIEIAGHSYSAETLEILSAVLDEAWGKLSPMQQLQLPRSQIAERLLQAAADGERDPRLLELRALDGLMAEAPLAPESHVSRG